MPLSFASLARVLSILEISFCIYTLSPLNAGKISKKFLLYIKVIIYSIFFESQKKKPAANCFNCWRFKKFQLKLECQNHHNYYYIKMLYFVTYRVKLQAHVCDFRVNEWARSLGLTLIVTLDNSSRLLDTDAAARYIYVYTIRAVGGMVRARIPTDSRALITFPDDEPKDRASR